MSTLTERGVLSYGMRTRPLRESRSLAGVLVRASKAHAFMLRPGPTRKPSGAPPGLLL